MSPVGLANTRISTGYYAQSSPRSLLLRLSPFVVLSPKSLSNAKVYLSEGEDKVLSGSFS